ncbi:uncharacterized protein LOC111248264 isoform X2 [Varroa destructor]|uniref:CRESS-DNA virus Rep endonuclease domain-containing protein n=1 Tax=Varroa destructor TaxID=109461 RepID=A0A7M7JRG4_VARDE|nr:uncharacterized protein LOC111248264 isoform X2 [Varroa destructor]
MAARQLRFRRAAWTLNNYTEEELKNIKENVTQFRYIIWGYEIAPNTGTKHLQGYAATEKPSTLDRFKTLLSDRAHIEIAKASEEKNREYCIKSGHFEEFGRINSQGQRNDLYNVVDTLLDNKDDPIGAVAESHPVAFIKFHRGIKDLATTLKLGAKRNHRTKLCIVYGYPGTGKSFGVRQKITNLAKITNPVTVNRKLHITKIKLQGAPGDKGEGGLAGPRGCTGSGCTMSAGSRRTSAPGLWLEAARLSTGNTNDKQPDGSNQQRGTILTGNDQLGSPLANGPLISKTRYEAARDSLSTLQIGDRRSDFRRGQYHRETSKTRNKATIREKHKTKKNENNNQGKQDTRKKGLQQSYGPSSSSSNSIDGIEPPTRIPQILPTYTPSDQWHFSGQQFYFEHKGEQKQPFILTEQYR